MKYLVSIFAVGGISIIELYALSQGINGTALSLSIAGIAGLGGSNLKKVIGEK